MLLTHASAKLTPSCLATLAIPLSAEKRSESVSRILHRFFLTREVGRALRQHGWHIEIDVSVRIHRNLTLRMSIVSLPSVAQEVGGLTFRIGGGL